MSPKVATPAVAATVSVPDSVAFAVPVPLVIASVTSSVKPAATLPWASRAVTAIDGLIDTPAVASLGSTVKSRSVAVPAVMSNVPLVAGVSPLAVKRRV